MKKIILTALVILTFSFYSLQNRFNLFKEEEIEIIAAANIADTQATSPVPTEAPTPTIIRTPTPAKTKKPSTATPVTTTPTPALAPKPSGQYRDGAYTGPLVNVYYGNVQVKAIVSGGKISDAVFLDYPRDRGHSVEINSQAMPLLTQEAIQVQSSAVDIVSGATATSQGFRESLAGALSQAKN